MSFKLIEMYAKLFLHFVSHFVPIFEKKNNTNLAAIFDEMMELKKNQAQSFALCIGIEMLIETY